MKKIRLKVDGGGIYSKMEVYKRIKERFTIVGKIMVLLSFNKK